MPTRAEPSFVTLHALRVRGMATTDLVADMCAIPAAEMAQHLDTLVQQEWVSSLQGKSLWRLTASGRDEHARLLAEDRGRLNLTKLAEHYASFLRYNSTFKAICTAWQLRDGQINDHSDARYDHAVIERLLALDTTAQDVVAAMGNTVPRLAPYARRLRMSRDRLADGDHSMVAGVMCGSYHDVWMELHEDLLLTQGIERSAEGSA